MVSDLLLELVHLRLQRNDAFNLFLTAFELDLDLFSWEPGSNPILYFRKSFHRAQMEWDETEHGESSSDALLQASSRETVSALDFHSFTRHVNQNYSISFTNK